MFNQIQNAFEKIGFVDVFERARDIRINEYLDSGSTTIKFCGIAIQSAEQTEIFVETLRTTLKPSIRVYHHYCSEITPFGGLVVRIPNYLLSDPSLLKVQENLIIPSVNH